MVKQALKGFGAACVFATTLISATPLTATAPAPFLGAPVSLPGTIEAENFDNGGEGVAYHDTTSGNSGGRYRSGDVDIESASEGGYDVGWISGGEWLAYSVNVSAAGAYLFEARVASLGAGGMFHLQSGNVNVTGPMMIPDTGAWQAWTTVSKVVTLTSGPQLFKVVFDTAGANGVGNVTWFRVSASVPPSPPPVTGLQIVGQLAASAPSSPAPAPPAPAPPPPVSQPPTANAITVHAGADLQAAINRALPGDTILLDAGATYTGNFVLPAKSGTDFVTIRSSAPDTALPGATTRIDPSYAPQLPKLQSPNSQPALATESGAHHYRLTALEFLANPSGYYDMLDLGDGSSLQNTLNGVPHDLIVDRVYMHGSPSVGEKRAIGLNSAATTITNSYISEIKFPGQDSQAIAGWNGPGPYTITNNYLEAASENILFGGSDSAIPNLVPSNITISGNYITKPVTWRGQNWGVKNAIELKSAAHVVIVGNVMENSWVEAQTGSLVVFTVRDQDGTAPWSTIQDVTLANNVIRHGASFLSILGLDDDPVARPSVRMSSVHVTGNLVYDIDPQKWNDPLTGAWGLGRLVQILGGPLNLDVSHNTMLSAPNSSPQLNSAVTIGGPGDTYKSQGLTIRNNVMAEGQYGLIGDSVGIGKIALDTYAPGWSFDDNLLIRGASGGNYSYPTTTTLNAAGVPVLDPSTFTVLPGFAGTATTDGKTIGADISLLRSTIVGLDLTK